MVYKYLVKKICILIFFLLLLQPLDFNLTKQYPVKLGYVETYKSGAGGGGLGGGKDKKCIVNLTKLSA